MHRLPLRRGTVAASIAGRREAAQEWAAWAATSRRRGSPLVWVHAASVGEILVADPVIAALRERIPALQVALTHSSPAVARWPCGLPADVVGYLPLDEAGPVTAVLRTLRPTLIAFARGDVWPEVAIQAAAHGVRLAVMGATVRRHSRRLSPLARPFYRRIYRLLSWVGAVSADHAARWIRLGAPAAHVEVTGDPRHDLVLQRAPDPAAAPALVPWAAGRTVLVAGSTEPADEGVLLRAAALVLPDHPAARLLVVPHDPTPARIRRLIARARQLELAVAVWDRRAPTPDRAIVAVAEAGLLFDLYGLGEIAYVGGGFRPGGLHAVIEPAALGRPVAFGPCDPGVADAEALVARGGGIALPRRRPHRALARVWRGWLASARGREAAGRAAQDVLRDGSAEATARALRALVEGRLTPGY